MDGNLHHSKNRSILKIVLTKLHSPQYFALLVKRWKGPVFHFTYPHIAYLLFSLRSVTQSGDQDVC